MDLTEALLDVLMAIISIFVAVSLVAVVAFLLKMIVQSGQAGEPVDDGADPYFANPKEPRRAAAGGHTPWERR